MRFFIEDLEVLFPYEYIYPEQYAYMVELKKVMNSSGHGLLEMPSGTGKTVTLLSFFTSYLHAHPGKRKLVYCSRTVPEINKALEELQFVMNYRQSYYSKENKSADLLLDSQLLAIGLSSRRNLCIHPQIRKHIVGKVVDARCYELTAPFRRERAAMDSSVETCTFFEKLHRLANLNTAKPSAATLESLITSGIFTLDDIRAYGERESLCPYFLSRLLVPSADILIYSYYYILDPTISEIVSKHLDDMTIVVFDEAHNIDNVALEVLSVDLHKGDIDRATRSCERLSNAVKELKQKDKNKLQDEYSKLLEGLRKSTKGPSLPSTNALLDSSSAKMFNPIIPEDIVEEALPGSIRKADHFLSFLKRFVEYLKVIMRGMTTTSESPVSFTGNLQQSCLVERRPLSFVSERLSCLIRYLQLTGIDELSSLFKIAHFGTLVGTYTKGFSIIFEPFSESVSVSPTHNDAAVRANPILHLACLDPAVIMSTIFARFRNVVITSGTLSPLDMYPQILQFSPKISQSFPMTLARPSFLPLIVTRGADQVPFNTSFQHRGDIALFRNYGHLVIEFCKYTPDGLVLFFPSYYYMKLSLDAWHKMGLINEILTYKLIFLESTDAHETTKALECYKIACDNGRGAIFMSVARGKVSEGVDFAHHYGRAVLLIGIPYQYTESLLLKAKLEYLREAYGVREGEFLTFDALRQAAQCLGRVIRNKTDYGLMILADKRFARADKRNKLPGWIQGCLLDANLNLSTDMAVSLSRDFFKRMGQSSGVSNGTAGQDTSALGVSLWTVEHLLKHQQNEA